MSVRIGSEQDRTPGGAIRCLEGQETSLTPGAALALLVDGASQDEGTAGTAVDLLRQLLREDGDPQVRAAVPRALAAVGTPEAVAVLREGLDEADDPSMRVALLAALSRVGDGEDLRRVAEAADQLRDSPWHEQAAVAVRLLGHRHGIRPEPTDDEGPAVLPPPEHGRPIEVTDREIVDHTRLEPADRRLVGDGFARAVTLRCARVEHEVLIDPGRLERLAAEPLVPAVVLGRNETTGAPFVRFFVFTDPDMAGEVAIQVARASGRTVFVGRGRFDGTVGRAELVSVDRPGASAVAVQISLSPEGVAISGVSDPRVSVPRRKPTPDR